MLASKVATPLALLFVLTCASTSYAINDPIITDPAPVAPYARARVKAGSAVTVKGWANAPTGTQFSVYFSGYGSFQTNSTADGKFSCNTFAPPVTTTTIINLNVERTNNSTVGDVIQVEVYP